MTEQMYARLTAFEASGGEYTISPKFVYPLAGVPQVSMWQCSVKYRGVSVDDALGHTPESACFLAFDTLHSALPKNAVKW